MTLSHERKAVSERLRTKSQRIVTSLLRQSTREEWAQTTLLLMKKVHTICVATMMKSLAVGMAGVEKSRMKGTKRQVFVKSLCRCHMKNKSPDNFALDACVTFVSKVKKKKNLVAHHLQKKKQYG